MHLMIESAATNFSLVCDNVICGYHAYKDSTYIPYLDER